MKPVAAIVESVFDYATREINALEQRIVTSEDEADALLWEQAAQVVAQLDAGASQRKLAATWINARTGEPYSVAHVNYTAKVYRVKFTEHPRARFRDCYNAVSNNPHNRFVHNSGDFEWYTPAVYVDAARVVLGGAIDLDPASTATANDVVRAARFYDVADDGLSRHWRGRVWMNPPYAQPLVTQFCEKLAESVRAGTVTAAVVIVNNASDTRYFRVLTELATAICLPPRVHFWKPQAAADAPMHAQVVVYIGPDVDRFYELFAPLGSVWRR
jgi:ParB family chromosome partitioning protein